MNDTEHEEIMKELAEIKEVLLGTYKERGIISRIASLEKYWMVVGAISLTALTGMIGEIVAGVVAT